MTTFKILLLCIMGFQYILYLQMTQTSKESHSNKYSLTGYLFCVILSGTLFMYSEIYSLVLELLVLLILMSKYISIRHSLF